jgi:hypothetical protein
MTVLAVTIIYRSILHVGPCGCGMIFRDQAQDYVVVLEVHNYIFNVDNLAKRNYLERSFAVTKRKTRRENCFGS